MDQNDLQSMREVTNGGRPGSADPSLEEPSALERFSLAITSPREAFRGLLDSERLGSIIGWGLLISMIVILFGTIAVTSNPTLMQKQMDERRAKVEKQHDDGKMSDKVYEASLQGLEHPPAQGMMLGFAIGGTIIGAPLIFLFMGLIIYAVSRVLQTEQDTRLQYSTALAMLLIASMVSNIGTLVQFVGTILTQNPKFSLDLAMIVDPSNEIVRSLLGLTNPFTLWALAVTGLGIASIARTSWAKSTITWGIILVFGLTIIGTFKQMF